MYKMIRFLRRKPEMSAAEFSRYWREQHGPLIRDTPEISRHLLSYTQHHIRENRGPGGKLEFDGIAETVFRSKTSFDACLAESATKHLRDDELNFIDPAAVVFVIVEDAFSFSNP